MKRNAILHLTRIAPNRLRAASVLLTAGLLLASLLTAACGATGAAAATSAATRATTTAITAGPSQTLVMGRITDIKGNDLVLALVRETALPTGAGGPRNPGGGAGAGTGGTQSAGQGTTTASGQGSATATTASGQETTTASGQGGSRQRPTGTGADGQARPSGQGGQARATGNAGGAGRATASGESGGQQAATLYALTGETLGTRIPVGVKVTTAKGAVTTFSRLAVGDLVRILMENSGGAQVPVAVWIVG